eukprot:m51a1_g4795 putative meiotic recombination protein spo11 (423) ;mRNA; r:81059-83089
MRRQRQQSRIDHEQAVERVKLQFDMPTGDPERRKRGSSVNSLLREACQQQQQAAESPAGHVGRARVVAAVEGALLALQQQAAESPAGHVGRARVVAAVEGALLALVRQASHAAPSALPRRPLRLQVQPGGPVLLLRRSNAGHFAAVAEVLRQAHASGVHGGAGEHLGGQTSLRAVFYRCPALFGSQRCSDRAVDRAATLVGTAHRSDLGISASAKGAVAGGLWLVSRASGAVVLDARAAAAALAADGVLVPPAELDSGAVEVRTAARLALVVEKRTVFAMLAASRRFWSAMPPCVLLTGSGYPDRATRALVRHVAAGGVPVLALVDWDPDGVAILRCYDSPGTTLRWLGLHCRDIAADALLPLSQRDARVAARMAEDRALSPQWREQLHEMLGRSSKAETESLGAENIVEYVLRKVAQGQWI